MLRATPPFAADRSHNWSSSLGGSSKSRKPSRFVSIRSPYSSSKYSARWQRCGSDGRAGT
eukprot:4448560-Prymnesium_polylepis.2